MKVVVDPPGAPEYYYERRGWPCVFWIYPIAGSLLLAAGTLRILFEDPEGNVSLTAGLTFFGAFVMFLCAVAFRYYAVRIQDDEIVFGYASWLTRKRIKLTSIARAVAIANTTWTQYGGCGLRWMPPDECIYMPTLNGPSVCITLNQGTCVKEYIFLCNDPNDLVDIIQARAETLA